VKLRESDTTPELAEPYFYYGQALLYLGLGEQQVFGSDIVKGDYFLNFFRRINCCICRYR
jgi:hypothetical protein